MLARRCEQHRKDEVDLAPRIDPVTRETGSGKSRQHRCARLGRLVAQQPRPCSDVLVQEAKDDLNLHVQHIPRPREWSQAEGRRPVIADRPQLSQNPGMKRMRAVLVSLALFSLLNTPLALAWREPTLREREQITNWYPAQIRNAPVRCVFIVIHVSSKDARYALTYAQLLNALKPHSDCLRYAANGFVILKRHGAKWTSIYSGSVEPPCSLKVPRDLTRCS
jgi:hypothetical protein